MCDAVCDCEDCSDREYDDCLAQADYELDRAAAYDCSEYVELLFDCGVDHNHCDNDHFHLDDTCESEHHNLNECIDDHSSLDNNVDYGNGDYDPYGDDYPAPPG